jgi:hypothetical protein
MGIMAALLMGPAQDEILRAVRVHAEANRIPRAELVRRYEAHEPVLDAGCRCELPVGFKVAFTIEEHPPPAGWARHLSVSAPVPGRLPNSYAMALIGRALGMRMQIFDPTSTTYFEPLDGGPPRAVNVIEPIEREPESHAIADDAPGPDDDAHPRR